MAVVPDLLRLLVGVTLLSFASYTDWRWRRAPNVLWLVMAGAGLALLAADVALDPSLLRTSWPYLALAPAFAALVYGLWYFGLIAGGADAKALMAMGLLMPWPLLGEAGLPLLASPLPGSFVVLTNSLLAFMVVPLAFLVWNLAHGDVRLPHAFLGLRRPAHSVRQGHAWPMETVEEDGTRRTRLFASRMSAEETEAVFDRVQALGAERVWVSPKIPFMIPLLAGFVTTFLVGDVLQAALRATLG